jgi:hypothetical protein
MPCMCGDPTCWSCGPAQGFHVHSPFCVGEDGTYECGEKEYGEENVLRCPSCDSLLIYDEGEKNWLHAQEPSLLCTMPTDWIGKKDEE